MNGSISDSIKKLLITMVEEAESELDRTVQTDLGPSQVGHDCPVCLAKMILGIPIDMGDPWLRIIGTATHDWLEEAAARFNVRHNRAILYPERKVYPNPDLLPSGGSSDLYYCDERTVIDHKIVGLTTLRKVKSERMPRPQYRRQAHLYGLGYTLAGVQVDHVAVAYWHRGGRLPDLWVWSEPFDIGLAADTLARYQKVKDIVTRTGPAIIDHLTSDPDCFDCQRSERTPQDAARNQLAGILPA